MSDYNDGKLTEPCLRLPYGGTEYASVELGDGTGYVRFDWYERLESENARLRRFADEKLRHACSALVSRLRVAEEQLEMEGALLDMRLVGDLRELGVEVDDVR